MISFRQGDVLLVPYPFTDQSGSKQRLVRRKLGELSAADRTQVRALFARVLDLP